MAAFPRVVCWQNREEWLQIYHYLYKFEEPSLQKKAVDRIAAWRSRSSGKLPIAIECTAHLVSAGLADDFSSDPTRTRLTLSMALVRFVNGMVDSGQKGLYARSVQSIAEEIGLPDWLVDLRHEATHAQLPSLETLRSGLGVALNWLKDEYWEAQMTIHSESEENLIKLLKVYEDKQIECMKSKKKHKKMKKEDVVKLIQDIVNVAATNNLWSEAVSHLRGEHLLIPSSQTFNRLELDFPEIPGDDVLPRVNLPQEVFLLWKPLLEALDQASSEFIPSLTTALLDDLLASGNDESNAKEFFLSALLSWLSYILDSCSYNVERNEFRLVSGCHMPWSRLLEICLKQPSNYSLLLLPIVLSNLATPDNTKQKIEHLVQVFLHWRKISPHETENNNCVSSIPDNGLRGIVDEMRNKGENVAMTAQGKPWSLAIGPTQWQMIALGEVLGAGANCSLDLEDNFTFSCKDMENGRDKYSKLPAVDELDRLAVTSQSEEDEAQHHSTDTTVEQVMVTDDSSYEFESDCTKFPAESVTDIQRIQNAIYLY